VAVDRLISWILAFGASCIAVAIAGPLNWLLFYLAALGVVLLVYLAVALTLASALESCPTQQPQPT
jgi:hypothetical protein